MTDREWLPRTTREKLIKIDTVLAEVIPRFAIARARVVDLMPGHSGRPAGNGDPPGGSGGHGATVVERCVLGADLDDDVDDGDPRAARLPRSAESAALADLDRYAARVVDRVLDLVSRAGLRLPGPVDNGQVRRLTWARWAVRTLEQSGAHVTTVRVDRLWFDVEHLASVCSIWGPARVAPAGRSDELAADSTEQWCRSHLRVGARVPRSRSFSTDGLCSTCGRFLGEQGWLPTLEILDALVSGVHGSTIARMIRDEHALRRKAKTTKRGRRRGRR